SKEEPVRKPRILVLSVCLLTGASITHAQKNFVDCSKESLASALAKVTEKDQTIQFTGVCSGPLAIKADGLTLKGVGTAVIDGAGQDAVTIAGTDNVTLSDFEVRNGL